MRHAQLLSVSRLLLITALVSGAWSSPAIAYESLGLRLPPAVPGEPELERGERLALIDSLESNWDELDDEEKELRRVEITRLYSSSDLIKHRVWAAEIGEERLGDISLRRLLAAARARQLVQNPWSAERICQMACESFPDSAAAHRELGRIRLEHATRTLDQEGFREARRAFVDAVRCPDAGVEDWRGLAGALLAEGRPTEIGRCAPHLIQQENPSVGDLLLAAAGRMGEGLGEEAQQLFEAAVVRMGPETQRLFLATEMGPAEDSDYGAWVNTLLRERGASRSTRLLWYRLIETEILFGRPDSELHGWNTAPGSLFLRYGHPDDMMYDPHSLATTGLGLEEIMFGLNLSPRTRQHVADELTMRSIEIGDNGKFSRMWIWVYDLGGYRVPFFFRGLTEHSKWRATRLSVDRAELVSGQIPIVIDPLEESAELDLAIKHAAFRTPDALIRAEAVIAISRPESSIDASDSFQTSFTILNEEGDVVESRSRILDDRNRRATLLSPWGLDRESDRAVVGQLDVELPPGTYVMRVEVEDLITGAYRASDRRFELTPPERIFGMSDLQLCDLFIELPPDADIPDEFVKHANVVIPHPEKSAFPDQEALFLYFEVYGAMPDESGQVHLDTIYEIWKRDEFHPTEAGLPRGQRVTNHPVVRADFPDERIGRTESGVVVKGTRIELDELGPGNYVIAVMVSDRLGRDESRRFLKLEL